MAQPLQPRGIQACITNVSFPQTLDNLEKMLHKNRDYGNDWTDLQILLEHKPGDMHSWTAPSWLTAGDILFFYHAASAPERIRRLQKEVDQLSLLSMTRHHLGRVLSRAASHAERYAGTLVGCAEIIDKPEYARLEEDERHFKSRLFAPFDRVDLFQNPIPPAQFKTLVSISRQSTLTPLDGEQFNRLCQD